MLNKFRKHSDFFIAFFCGFFSSSLKDLLSVKYPVLNDANQIQDFFVHLAMFLILYVIVTLLSKVFNYKSIEKHS
jgi:hypothetical protein